MRLPKRDGPGWRKGKTAARAIAAGAGWTGLAGHFPVSQFFLPLVHQWPIDRAGAKLGHVKVTFQTGNRAIEQLIILAENRTMAR